MHQSGHRCIIYMLGLIKIQNLVCFQQTFYFCERWARQKEHTCLYILFLQFVLHKILNGPYHSDFSHGAFFYVYIHDEYIDESF